MAGESKKDAPKESDFRKFLQTKGIVVALSLVALVGVGVGIYYFLQYQKTQKSINNPASAGQFELKETVEKVGKLVELPKEQPQIATVSDVSKLKNQQFFANAQNGDKVLIYEKAKKAILYRPSTNKIVEFGPINLGSANPTQQNTASESAAVTLKPVRVVIYNGTTTAGLANAVEKDFVTKASYVTVISKGNAVKRDYTKTLIVDVKGSNKAEAQGIAKLLQGSVGKLPAGEKATSSADILVIIGRP